VKAATRSLRTLLPARRDLLLPGGVALAALAVRLLYLRGLRRSPLWGYFVADQSYYRDWALGIATGDWVSPAAYEQGPLYAWLLGLVYRCCGARDGVVLAGQLLAGVLTVLLVHDCARRVFGARAALAAALLAALYGPLVFHEGLLMKTWLEPLLALASLSAALRYAAAARLRWLLAAAAAVGLLALVREVHLLLLLPLAVGGWRAARALGVTGARRLRHLAAAGLACALAVAPATLRNGLSAGELVPVTTGGGEVLYLAWGPWASAYYRAPPFIRPWSRLEHQDFQDEASLRTGRWLSRAGSSAFWYRETLAAAAASPGRLARLTLQKVRGLLNDYEFPDSEHFEVARRLVPALARLPTFGWVAGAGIVGVALALRTPAQALLPLLFLGCAALEVVATYAFGRFRLVVAPFLLIFAGHALARLVARAASRRPRDLLACAGGVLAALAVTSVSLRPPPVDGGEGWVRQIEADFAAEVAIRGEQGRVAAEIERHLAGSPGDAASWETLGGELEVLGRLPEARRAHRAALAIDPGRAAPHWALANLAYRQGRLDQAVEHARAFVAGTPGSSQAHLALAVFSARLALEGRDTARARALREEADAHFAEAARLDAGNAAIPYYRGKAAALSGDWEGGARELTRALDLDPASLEARHVLALVRPHLRAGAP
jgi:tetratricopeptide (TPR) repeat protein